MLEGRTAIFVKEQVAFVKLRDTYDLLDPETMGVVGEAKDEPASWAKWLRLLVKKALLPTTLNVRSSYGQPVLSVRKHPGFLWTRLEVVDASGRTLAMLRSRLFSLGGAFRIMDASGNEIGDLKGDWKGWEYAATIQGRAIGQVTKKWAGIFKEAFTNADQYLVRSSVSSDLPLMLGLALAVDLVYKEQQR
nr:phospholipid scramblase-related protein [uncultured Holophaga sp.]